MAADRPRILLIVPQLPYPPNQGTRVLSFALIRALKDEFDVTVLARLLSEEELEHAEDLEEWCDRVITDLAPNRRSFYHRVWYKAYYGLQSLIRRRSLKSLYDCPGTFQKKAKQLAAESFDLVIIEYWQLFRLLPLYPPERTVLLTLDIDMLVNRQATLLERNLVKKVKSVQRWLLEQREEVQAYRTARHVWTLTKRDKHAVESLARNGTSVDVMPFGVDLDFNRPSGMERNHGEVLFLGYMGASFNRDAIDFFVRRIYPHLDETPGLSITVVGGGLPEDLKFFGLEPEVEVVGRVVDVRPYLHRAGCLVVPLRFGGGLRIRILEAMAAGVPIVCTSVAIAGMPFEAGAHYREADDPAEFARAVRDLVENPETANRMADAAYERVQELYAGDTQARRTVALVRRLIDPERARP